MATTSEPGAKHWRCGWILPYRIAKKHIMTTPNKAMDIGKDMMQIT